MAHAHGHAHLRATLRPALVNPQDEVPRAATCWDWLAAIALFLLMAPSWLIIAVLVCGTAYLTVTHLNDGENKRKARN